MVKRYDLITELYGRTIREITEKPENWMAFLRSACRNFRLPFDEQVLVYVQRPDAVAVLGMEGWRNKFGRWVKRDASGIAVFDKQAPAMRLKYYYDVSDTREGRFKRLLRTVPLWEMEDEDRGAVQETLANTFGVEENEEFEETILVAGKNAAEDNLPDYMHSLLSNRADSFLEELDELNVEVKAKRLLAASVSYMIMARCGLQTESYLDVEDFQDIRDFNTPAMINSLGVAISDVAEMALLPVSKTVWQLREEQKSRNRTFEEKQNGKYHESVKANPDTERSPGYGTNSLQQAGGLFSAGHLRIERTSGSPWEIRISAKKISSEGTVRDVHNLADAGQAEPASHGNTGGSTDADGANHKRDGSERERDRGTQSERPDVVGGNDEQYPSGGRGNSDEGTDLPLEWYDRSREDKSLPFFGSDSDIKSLLLTTPHLKATKEEICFFYETHEDKKERTEYVRSIFNNEYTEITLEDGRKAGYKTYQNVLHLWEGSYQLRTAQAYYDWSVIAQYFEGMRLMGELWDRWKPIPTVEGQLSLLDDMAEEKSSVFSFSQEIIDYVLTQGSGIEQGKYRIYSYFLQEHTTKEKADFLKNEYGIGGHSPILTGTGIGEEHDAKGLKLYKGYGSDAPELLLTWGKVAKRIDELMAAGRYMTKQELEYIPEYEKDNIKTEPEIPQKKRNQFRITNDGLGQGTPKEKFRANITAIQTLKKCEDEGRLATPDEQKLLSGYVGWGGLSDAFDETKTAWSTEYLELKSVLTPEEYTAARESTLTAFYTPPVVIRAMYHVLENMGLKSGNILEPSCASGNFIGMKPESLSDCKMYGVEIDPISGRIARQLYQQSTIAIQGYEEADLPDSFFDVAVGNVPFGQFKVLDQRYDRHNFLIHDYFFAKTLDKVRPGGVIAFITSSGTMDKKNLSIRKYIAQRAELIGAVRLPNDTFKRNAGTEVTADILFLQKRDRIVETEPEWLYLDVDENGVTQNRYFVEHPEMVLGEMVMETTQYGMASTCRPYEDKELESLLSEAVENIQAEIQEYEAGELTVEETDGSIPADPSVPNFSYTISEGKIYYRENSRMKPVELSVTGANRVKGMIAIRDLVRELIACQTEGYPDTDVERCQKELNRRYDVFRSRYGLLNARANSMVFSDDNSYPLLCSLEILKEDGTLERKADMFTKRTIRPHKAVEKVDTAAEALSVSLSEKARVDMEYMCSLTGKSVEELEKELSGVIFRLPDVKGKEPHFVSEDEYLSGNVREKLKVAELAAQTEEVYQTNVEALKKVQPKELTASEISIRLGTTWVPTEDIAEFIFELLDTPNYARWNIKVHFAEYTGEWQIEGKSQDKGNVKANNTYGTHRASAYKIIEDTLNLRDTRIYDYEVDDTGKKKAILNKEETAIAQGKQDLIKQAFQDWIWKEPERRQRLTDYYNEHFNAIRPREYDGSHLTFPGMNPEIKLRQHQKNGAARVIYGGNTLLAHVVGAGKTYTMVAAAMESKRLGLCNKSMIVVPNHIIEQFATEWLQLYPASNLLVATKKDFETKNRKKFCARIATSEIDAVIIGHSQFEKIPLSLERQRRTLEGQIEDVMEGIQSAKRQRGQRFTIKQLEKSKKSLQSKLKKLNNQSRKDDVVTFEELGIDRLFVDEADNYKNLYLYTKMRNVGGIAQTEAQKSSDMFMKCRYLDELTGGKGVIFATGTPISNSMVELYTMQRYLQYDTLVENQLQHFDAWASTFGETVTAIELAPEGTGYRLKTRFARFYNLPELMRMFREVADIQTADMLNLPVPEAEYRVVTVKPSSIQKEMVEELGNRAERVRNGMVNPMQDNMLLITNDGRKLALDQRLINEMLPDEPESKVNACVKEVYQFWDKGKENKLTQLLFCDLSTPKKEGTFSVYNDVRDKLIAKGVPPEEIAFIHDANTEVKKKELFSKVRRGAVRVLMGSTSKMGAGTNVQDLAICGHDLDCPWRPRDLEQRGGRVIRQGNKNPKVYIIRYVTEGTFDAYMYQLIENKQKYIGQIVTSKNPARSVEDIDEVALSYAEIKALAADNPNIREKMDLDIQVSKLQLLKQSFLNQRYEMEDKVTRYFPKKIKEQEQDIIAYEADIAQVRGHTPPDRATFPPMQINGTTYHEKKEAGQALIEACKAMKSPDGVPLGAYRGLLMELSYDGFSKEFVVTLKGTRLYHVPLGADVFGNIIRIDNEVEKFPDKLEQCKERLKTLQGQLETAKVEAKKEFSKEKELTEKVARLGELNALLDIDKKERVLLDEDAPEGEELASVREELVR